MARQVIRARRGARSGGLGGLGRSPPASSACERRRETTLVTPPLPMLTP